MEKIIFILTILLLFVETKADWKAIDSTFVGDSTSSYVMSSKVIKCYDDGFCIQLHNINGNMPWIKRSFDFGKTWESTLVDTVFDGIYLPSHLDDVDCYGEDCIALGDTNFYWLSNDRAKTWKKYELAGNRRHTDDGLYLKCFKDIYFAKFGTYKPNRLHYSIDKGLTWDSIIVNNPDSLGLCQPEDFVFFKDSNIKILMYSYIKARTFICETYDLGKNWVSNEYTPKRIEELHFFDENNGIGVGSIQLKSGSRYESSYIAKTIDGGKTWKTIVDTLMKIDGGVRKVRFSDNKHGIAIGFYELWITSDGGNTWKKDTSFNEKLYLNKYGYMGDATLLKDGRIFVLNSHKGRLYENTNFVSEVEDNPTTINNISYYPNPSKETLNLKLSTEPEINEELTITDILGNNVLKAPIKDIQSQVDISHLISGLYLCRLRQSGTVFKIEVVK